MVTAKDLLAALKKDPISVDELYGDGTRPVSCPICDDTSQPHVQIFVSHNPSLQSGRDQLLCPCPICRYCNSRCLCPFIPVESDLPEEEEFTYDPAGRTDSSGPSSLSYGGGYHVGRGKRRYL